MTIRPPFGFALLLLALGFVLPMPVAAQPVKDAPIQIGLVKQFFNDVPAVQIEIVIEPFGGLMKDATGLDGKLSYADDAFEVARKLDRGDFQIGVFHGHEFAWLQKKYPKLQPLMVAVNQYNDVRAYVIVNKNNSATDLNGLRGKTIDMPLMTKEHCCVHLERTCSDNCQICAKSFFKNITRCKSPTKAIDDVMTGQLDAVVVDTITLEHYKKEKGPAFEKFLKVVNESVSFPPPVIVYKDGVLPAATIEKFRAGLANAHENANGKDMLTLWQIARFLPVPADFSKSLADSLHRYPAPTSTKVQAME